MILTIVNCKECGITKRDTLSILCDVCQSIFDSLTHSDYWTVLTHEWHEENKRRIEAKKRIMRGDQHKEAA